MSGKSKHKRDNQAIALAVLRDRVTLALGQERFQHGLELARALAKRDPSEANQELLRRAILGRARQLRQEGKLRDAGVLLAASHMEGGPAFLAELAQELAACGELRRALETVQNLPEPALQAKVLARAADAAIVQGQAGKALLPAAVQDQFDLIMRAFALVEAGQDEAAREVLQGVGLQSPFLEWKLLLRGLMAYYGNDDNRAVENWQRLDPERWPARLAAPFRFQIDKDFRTAQPAATQTALLKQADHLQSPGLVQLLRSLQAALSNERQLPQAFRQAETLLAALRREAPALVPRLAACFFWAIVHHGHPEDVRRYQRVFGAPADDPELNRLEALALEHRGLMQDAHDFWQKVEKGIASSPAVWPGAQANRARALIWWHMGHNADEMPEMADLPDVPPFLRGSPVLPKALKPSAEQCYQRSQELAPDQRDAYLALITHHLKKDQASKAEKAARRLLKQFPDHAPTLETLGDLRMQAQDYAEAVDAFEKALKGNPLERRLRAKLSVAHTFHARSQAEAGHFEAARAEYQAALAYREGRETWSVLCKWAACEFKAAEETRGEELLQQALVEKGNHLAVAFSMMIEAARLKLPPVLKKRFDLEVGRLLAEPPTAEAAAALAITVSAHRQAGVTYYGQKTHEKKVLTYLEKARKQAFTEQQLIDICLSLEGLDRTKLLRSYTHLGQQQHPTSPVFFLLEAQQNVAAGPYRCDLIGTRNLLKKARELAVALPRDDRREKLLAEIQDLEQEARLLNPFAGLFSGGGLDPFAGEDDDFFDP